jgi:hypothetical protein
MEPGDSKNYTCIPTTDVVGNSKNGSSYKHYVIGTYEYDDVVRVMIIIIYYYKYCNNNYLHELIFSTWNWAHTFKYIFLLGRYYVQFYKYMTYYTGCQDVTKNSW